MRVSELSDATGVSVPSLKYYLREGLLHPGTTSGRRNVSYDQTHVARVRLIRALIDSGGLSIAALRSVVEALERDGVSWHDLMGTAQYALSAPQPAADQSVVSELLEQWGWHVQVSSPVRAELAVAIEAARSAGVLGAPADLAGYAEAMRAVARIDLASVPRTSPEAALHQVVVGTVLLDPVLAALRKLAQEDVSVETPDAALPVGG